MRIYGAAPEHGVCNYLPHSPRGLGHTERGI